MAAAQLVAGQGRGQQQRRRGLGHLAVQEARQGPVQGAQPAAFHPARQQVHQRRRLLQGRMPGLGQVVEQVLHAEASVA